MKPLRLYAAVSCFFLFLSCVENEIETFDISIDIQPHGSATIEPKVYGPLFAGRYSFELNLKLRTMNVFVEKHKDGTYWGTVTEVPGVVASYGNTLSELKSNVEQAYADYYELAVDLKEDYVVNLEKKPDFTYLLNLKNIFHLLPEVKVSNIANKANINPSLLRQYKTGKAKAS